ncbi:hypothetical protein EC991_000355 [Linnemannia zychae]|nr:hypothetical protein EC991_000355 [Linnemannia zychae]
MMFVGLGAAGSSSRYGGDGYPDPPDLPRPPRAGFHREERPGSGSWSARSGYSGGGSSIGRKPFVANHSGIFDEKGYHAEAAGLGGARVSVMGGVGGGVGGYNSNLSGESFTQLYDGRFVANGRRGEGSQGGYVAGDVDHYPYDAQEYDARMHSKEMSSSAAFLPSPPSSPEGAYPPEGISPTESTSSGTTGLDGAINGGPQPSPPLGTGPGPNPRASGYYDFNHHPLRTPSRTNMHGGPPLSPNGNFVNRSTSRMSSASVPYAPDGLPLFPPRPASQYQHANYHPHPGQQHYPAPRSPPPHMAGGGGGPGPNGYYSPRMGPQYQQQQPLHPYHQHPQQQARFSQLPPQPQVHSGPISPISPMTSSSITAYDENEHGIHSTQKFVSNESFEKHQMYEEVYVHPLPQSEVTGSAPQALVEDNKSNNVNAPAAATPVAVDGSEPTDLASLAPIVPKGPVSAPPLPLSTKPSIGQLSTP